MLTLAELAARLNPRKTVLFLGAGASIPSGAPAGEQLGKDLATGLQQRYPGGDLTEATQILERKVGRARLVEVLHQRLISLVPSTGLLVLPDLNWPILFSTNFDLLIEDAYKACNKPLVTIRSNFDWEKIREGTPTLFKIHGCISQDICRGDRGRIVLTERDYDEYSDFRKALFGRLALALQTSDVLFIGYSLRDRHIRDEVKLASREKRLQGAPGRIYVLVFDEDADRAAFIEEELGVSVCFGNVDTLMHAMASKQAAEDSTEAPSEDIGEHWMLPISIRASSRVINHTVGGEANAMRLFSGSPASFADITNGFTFQRTMEAPIIERLEAGAVCVSIVGVSGVGKTTMSRRIAHKFAANNYFVWEHDSNFSLDSKSWASVSETLARAGKRGLILIDDCTAVLGQINRLLEDFLSKQEERGLQVILVAERAAWNPRRKSKVIFENDRINTFSLSLLDHADIERMVDLTESCRDIQKLMSKNYAKLDHEGRVSRLRQRCSADMFVSLKYVFGSESLDAIILREYAALAPEHQDIYRTVAALEVSGTRVHRQLIIRLLNTPAYTLQGVLAVLEGIVDEYNINQKDGLYGWRTRHNVIARVVTEYKYSNPDEFTKLIDDVVENLNPSIVIEQQTIAALCNAEFGIKKVASLEKRIELYSRLISKAPRERIPYHRLIGDLIRSGQVEEADTQLRIAIDQVGIDPPLHRYKVRLALERATKIHGIQVSDRRVMLERAYNLAHEGIRRYPNDKYAYIIFEDIGLAFERICGEVEYLEEAVGIMKSGYERTLDPDLAERIERALRDYFQPRPP
ncbi:MAG: SIR2 family protein [Nannocystis sp.]|uniref:SIR2 family protein n=1 Tax=Nannocystis sp. TaxID=1962667 RepID=UPI002427D1FB|nr:SIR2 family protein [Nannocystis sp.]MBK9751894.1 SIR2 family protein [Nannocystis sp.]